ncbi:MAG TPA: hypothetical protein PLK55_04380 [archaeon]|jgi:hypothetical protein|nr:hypothetical protein [archaeon]
MNLEKNIQKGVLHYPTLKTILAIEKTIKEANKPINREQIKQKLQTKIHHQTLNLVLSYLEESGKIFIGKDGITWTFNDSLKFKKLVKEAIKVK